jgi:hypothetical protein
MPVHRQKKCTTAYPTHSTEEQLGVGPGSGPAGSSFTFPASGGIPQAYKEQSA